MCAGQQVHDYEQQIVFGTVPRDCSTTISYTYMLYGTLYYNKRFHGIRDGIVKITHIKHRTQSHTIHMFFFSNKARVKQSSNSVRLCAFSTPHPPKKNTAFICTKNLVCAPTVSFKIEHIKNRVLLLLCCGWCAGRVMLTPCQPPFTRWLFVCHPRASARLSLPLCSVSASSSLLASSSFCAKEHANQHT